MQNVVNYLVPFFAKDGSVLSGGRVHFVKPDCSSVPSGREDPDYIAIFDTTGTAIENPLGLNDLGQFSTQPFVSDGVNFRMLVEGPTGVPETLNSAAPAWELLYTIDSKTQKITVEFSGVSTCSGLPELRKADPASSPVVVLGYSAAGDFCPPRIFKFVEALYDENYGTHVRSTLSDSKNAGTWVCEPSGFLDVRWFGVDPDSDVSVSDSLTRAAKSYTNTALYFPAGTYLLSSGLHLYSAIVERNATFRVSGTNSVTMQIENYFENRGGKFVAKTYAPSSVRVIPLLSGTLRTSWLSGTLNEFLTAEALENIETFVVDSLTIDGTASVSISGKKVVLFYGPEFPNVSFSGCSIVDLTSAGELLNAEYSGKGVKVKGSGDGSALLKDGNLIFAGDDAGNTFARYGVNGAQVKDKNGNYGYFNPSLTSAVTGRFNVLEILESISAKGSAEVSGNMTVGGNATFGGLVGISDVLETVAPASSTDASIVAHKNTLFDGTVRVKGSIVAEGDSQGIYVSKWGLFGRSFGNTEPYSGVALHFVKVSDFGYTEQKLSTSQAPEAWVNLRDISGLITGMVVAFFADLSGYSATRFWMSDSRSFETTSNGVFLFIKTDDGLYRLD